MQYVYEVDRDKRRVYRREFVRGPMHQHQPQISPAAAEAFVAMVDVMSGNRPREPVSVCGKSAESLINIAALLFQIDDPLPACPSMAGLYYECVADTAMESIDLINESIQLLPSTTPFGDMRAKVLAALIPLRKRLVYVENNPMAVVRRDGAAAELLRRELRKLKIEWADDLRRLADQLEVVDQLPIATDAAPAEADRIATAVVMKSMNPTLSGRDAAAAVGLSHSALYRSKVWRDACDRLKQVGKGRVRRGTKNEGIVDAESDDE